MKHIIYLGYVVTPEEADTASGASVAGNKMQWNVVCNLSDIENTIVECVTVTPYASFPKDKMLVQRKETQYINKKIHVTRVGYINLPIIKQICQIFQVYFEGRRLMKKNPKATLLSFNMFPQMGLPMRWLKKKFPECQTVCLLADLPIDDDTKRKGFSKITRLLFDSSTLKNISSCDKYIVLNKNVAEKYLHNKQYIVVDGGVEIDDIQKYDVKIKDKSSEKNILYCGALTEYNGILNLLEAMKLLRDTEIVLDIYGGGYLEDVVRDISNQCKNIRYHGRVDNETVMKKQQDAWLLINPRVVNDPIAQVTFPSKTFEYLLSGTPVLTTRLNGYSEEYKNLMFFADDDTPEGLAESIKNVLKTDEIERKEIANRAKAFVINNRNWKVQTVKMFDFLFND